MKKTLHLRRQLSRARYFSLAFLGMTSLLGMWAAVSYSGLVQPLFLPTPAAVISSGVTLYFDFGLVGDILISLYRIVLGFLLSVIISVPLGVYLGINRHGQALFEPIINFVRYIPSSALLPLFILWFGIGELEKILLICFSVTPYFVVLVYDAIANTTKEYIEAGYTLGANWHTTVFRIIIPQALPGIWDAMRLIISAAWTWVILAEIVAATSGLGYLIITSSRFLQTSNVIAVILVIGTLGLLTDLLFRISYKRFFPWAGKTNYA